MNEFLSQPNAEVLARLSVAYANRGYTSQYSDQTLTWERDLAFLRRALSQCCSHSSGAGSWALLLEFSIPRKELRIDAVLLIGDVIALLEAKTGETAAPAKRQIEDYALLLHYFHQASKDHRIVPLLVSQSVSSSQKTVGFHALSQRGLFP